MDPQKYRNFLYEMREHPVEPPPPESMRSLITTSMALTLFLEFIVEKKLPFLPTGVFFPGGFALFWGVFFLYKEAGLSDDLLLFKNFFKKFQKPTPPLRNNVINLTPRLQTQPELPLPVMQALRTLELDNRCRNWAEVQKQFRTLAKKYHPDLNPDLTAHGSRFIACDQAYKVLSQYRGKLFF